MEVGDIKEYVEGKEEKAHHEQLLSHPHIVWKQSLLYPLYVGKS